MMRKKKRILSMLLTICMICSTISMPAYATEIGETPDQEASETVGETEKLQTEETGDIEETTEQTEETVVKAEETIVETMPQQDLSYTKSSINTELVDPTFEDTNSQGNYVVTGAYVLESDCTIPDNGSLTFAEGATLTVAEGVTLTYHGFKDADSLPEKGKLIINGTLGIVRNLCIGNETTLEAMIDKLEGNGSIWSESYMGSSIHDSICRIQRGADGGMVQAYGDWEYEQKDGYYALHKYLGNEESVTVLDAIDSYTNGTSYEILAGAFVGTAAKTIYLPDVLGVCSDEAFEDEQTVYVKNNIRDMNGHLASKTGADYSLYKQDYVVQFAAVEGYRVNGMQVDRYISSLVYNTDWTYDTSTATLTVNADKMDVGVTVYVSTQAIPKPAYGIELIDYATQKTITSVSVNAAGPVSFPRAEVETDNGYSYSYYYSYDPSSEDNYELNENGEIDFDFETEEEVVNVFAWQPIYVVKTAKSMSIYYRQHNSDGTDTNLGPQMFGSGIFNQGFTYGESVTFATNAPAKDGYTFEGWYTDNRLTNRAPEGLVGGEYTYNVFNTIYGTIYLYAKYVVNLDEKIAEATALKGNYTTLSAKELATKLNVAKVVASNQSATEAERIEAYNKLQAAMDALVDAAYTVTLKVEPDGGGRLYGAAAYGVDDEMISITAQPATGYIFDGWYDVNDKKTDLEASFTYTAREDVTYTAKFIQNNGLSIKTVGSGSVTLNGSTIIADYTKNTAVGTEITLVAIPNAGYEFVYWTDKANRVLNTNDTYTTTVGSAMQINAIFQAAPTESTEETTWSYRFLNKNGKLSEAGSAKNNTKIKAPTANPTLVGYTFKGWKIRGTEDSDLVTFGGENGFELTANTIFDAVFEKQQTTYSVTVDGGTVKGSSTTSGNFVFDANITIVADTAPVGQVFYCWRNANGENVSYSREYTFAVGGNVTFTAVFDTEAPEIMPTISGMIANVDKENKKISFLFGRTMPEGYTLVQTGCIATDDENLGNDKDAFVLGAAGIDFTKVATSTNGSGQYLWTKGTVSSTWYVRGYLTYKGTDNVSVTIYTNCLTGSLSLE